MDPREESHPARAIRPEESIPITRETPLAIDLAKTPEDRQAMELVVSPLLFARPLQRRPVCCEARKATLRNAFEGDVKDPEFLAEATKQKLEPELVTGAEIDAVLARLYKTPKGVVERVKAATN